MNGLFTISRTKYLLIVSVKSVAFVAVSEEMLIDKLVLNGSLMIALEPVFIAVVSKSSVSKVEDLSCILLHTKTLLKRFRGYSSLMTLQCNLILVSPLATLSVLSVLDMRV